MYRCLLSRRAEIWSWRCGRRWRSQQALAFECVRFRSTVHYPFRLVLPVELLQSACDGRVVILCVARGRFPSDGRLRVCMRCESASHDVVDAFTRKVTPVCKFYGSAAAVSGRACWGAHHGSECTFLYREGQVKRLKNVKIVWNCMKKYLNNLKCMLFAVSACAGFTLETRTQRSYSLPAPSRLP